MGSGGRLCPTARHFFALRRVRFAATLAGMKQRHEPSTFGIVIYEEVEPIDVGGTVGVVSMAKRVLPGIASVVIAADRGPVHLSGSLTVIADAGFDDHPPCDYYV